MPHIYVSDEVKKKLSILMLDIQKELFNKGNFRKVSYNDVIQRLLKEYENAIHANTECTTNQYMSIQNVTKCNTLNTECNKMQQISHEKGSPSEEKEEEREVKELLDLVKEGII